MSLVHVGPGGPGALPPQGSHRSVRAHISAYPRTGIPEASLCGAELAERVNEFQGSLVCRTRVSNAIDSFEKLLRFSCKANGSLGDADIRTNHAVNASLLAPHMERDITAAVEKDADLAKFRQYHETRLNIELGNAAQGSRRDKLVNDLRPMVTSEASAVEGRFTDAVTLAIRYQFDGSPTYESKVGFEAAKVVAEPSRETCQVTGMEYPADCLAKCEVSGSVALRHKLEESHHSGKLGLPSNLGTCEQTGQRALVTELDECCLTKQRVLRDMLVESEMTGRRAVAAHATRCEITGAAVLDDEVATSGDCRHCAWRPERPHLARQSAVRQAVQ